MSEAQDPKFQSRAALCDAAVRLALVGAMKEAVDQDVADGGDFDVRPIVRAALCGALRSLTTLAWDTGAVGKTREVIRQGFIDTIDGCLDQLEQAAPIGKGYSDSTRAVERGGKGFDG